MLHMTLTVPHENYRFDCGIFVMRFMKAPEVEDMESIKVR